MIARSVASSAWVLAALSVSFASGCGRESPPAAGTTTVSAPSNVSTADRCRDAVRRARAVTTHGLAADLDGDGLTERLYTARVGGNSDPCRFALVARGLDVSVAILSGIGFVAGPKAMPTIAGVKNLDGRPGRDVIVLTGDGASIRDYAIYAMRRGALRRLSVDPAPVQDPNTFRSGGVMSSNSTVSCAEEGVIVVATIRQQDASSVRFRRTRYASIGGGFHGKVVFDRVVRGKELARLHPYSRNPTPFHNC